MRRRGLLRSVMAVLVVCGLTVGVSASLRTSSAVSRIRSSTAPAPAGCGSSSSTLVSLYAPGVKPLSQTTIPVCATGAITVSFHSTPASCAALGPCGYAGTDSWSPANGGVLVLLAYRQDHRRHDLATLLLGQDNPVVAAVAHTTPGGVITECRDSDREFAGFLSPRVQRGRLTVGLDGGQPPLLGSRCVGPLDADLRPALPAASLALPAVLHSGATLDLSGVRPFASRDFAGQVSSDLVLRLGRARTTPANRRIGGPPGLLTRSVTESYRLQSLRGTLGVRVKASSAPAVCGGLDACGVTGRITIAGRPAHGGDISLTATGPAKRPPRDFLAALGQSRRGDRRGIQVGGAGQPAVHGSVTAQLSTPTVCRDTTQLFSDGLQLQTRGARLRITLSPAGSEATDPLRTRCPGPALGSRQLATAIVPLSALRHRTVTVALHGTRLTAGPYRLSTASTIKLTLRRTRQTTQTFRIPQPPR